MCPPVGGAVQITLNHTLLYKPKNWAIKHLDLIIYLNCLGCASLFRECMTLWITINVIFKLHNNIAHTDAIKPSLRFTFGIKSLSLWTRMAFVRMPTFVLLWVSSNTLISLYCDRIERGLVASRGGARAGRAAVCKWDATSTRHTANAHIRPVRTHTISLKCHRSALCWVRPRQTNFTEC